LSPKDNEYRAHAEQAERLAMASQSAEEREAYERIAAVWRELAEAEMEMAEPVRAEQQPGEATPLRATAKSQ
jgi:hypothetical protein